MKKLNLHVWSVVGVAWVIGCSGGSPVAFDDASESHATTGGKRGGVGGGHSDSSAAGVGGGTTNDNRGGDANVNVAGVATTAGTSSIDGLGGTGSESDAGATGVTYDPPPLRGGSGQSSDPPTSNGGSGNTEDPPPAKGGAGNTEDPPPAKGGAGNTEDPPPNKGGATSVGGAGNTDDPPPSKGGATSVGGAPATGGAATTGGSGTTDDPPKGGATSTGGSGSTEDPPNTGGKSATGGATGIGGSDATGGTSATGGTVATGGSTATGGSLGTGGNAAGGTGNVPKCVMSEIDKINVVVLKDAAPSSADVEGQMWVGGNATFQSWGYSANSTGVPELKLTCNEYGVIVGGDLNGTLVLGSGKAAFGGSRNGNFYSNANPQCSIYHESPVDFVALGATLQNYSATLRDYPANGTVTRPSGAVVLTGTSSTLNVFQLSAADLAATYELRLDVPAGSSVLVNVSGASLTWQNAGFRMPDGGAACRGGSSDWCHRILYNLYEAETVTLQGIGVQGSVLAPYATVDGGSGNIDGQLVCEYLYGALEYHPYFFTGCLQLPAI